MEQRLYEPPGQLSFGDVFIDVFPDGRLFDAHLRSDATELGQYQQRRERGGRFAYSPSIPKSKDYILAHGTGCRAILLSDDCAIDDALGVDREDGQKQGRLLFGAVRPATRDEIQSVVDSEPFDRFPLLPEGGFAGGIADLKRVFMVDVRDVPDGKDPKRDARIARLGNSLAAELAVRWSAYAARRGPLAAARNAEKLAILLSNYGDPDETHREVARLVAQVIAEAWRFEGERLDGVDAILKSRQDPSEIITSLIRDLQALSNSGAVAATRLGALTKRG